MGTLSGQVTIDGVEVAGAEVVIVDTAGSSDPTEWSVAGGTMTESNGSWSVSGLDGGTDRYHAMVQFEDGGQLYHAESLPFLTVMEVSPDPAGLSIEPIAPDISTLPDSEADQKLLHRWGLNDISGTVEDSVGSAEGTVNGVTSVSGDWAGGSAGNGDGNGDYIETTTWGGFGSSLDTDFAIAFSIQTTDTSGNAAILGNASFVGSMELFVADGRWGVPDNNTAAFVIRDGNDNDNSVYGTTAITDGNPYRVVINKSTNSASGWEVYVNQAEEAAVGRDDGTSSVSDFDSPTNLFARTESDGTDSFYVEAILDDICIFGDSLTQEEAQSYANPWDA